MSFTSRIFDLFLRIFAKPLLKYIPLVPERLRKMQAMEKKYSKRRKLPKSARETDSELNGVPALTIQKNQDYAKNDGIILYFHGGGYCAGSPHAYKYLLWPLAKACDLPVIAIDYRQSPYNTFPAGLDDSILAYKALLEQGYQANNIFIMGDSAGGNLTLATILKIKQLGLPNPAASVSISPWADLTHSGDSIRTNERRDSYLPGRKQLDVVSKLYAGDTPLTDPLLSPLFGDFTGMTPMKIIVGDIEVLYDDARRVAEKATAAGVEVDYKAWRGQCHVFPLFSFLPEAKQCQAEINEFVQKHKPAAAQIAA